jgi:hypothetical protein
LGFIAFGHPELRIGEWIVVQKGDFGRYSTFTTFHKRATSRTRDSEMQGSQWTGGSGTQLLMERTSHSHFHWSRLTLETPENKWLLDAHSQNIRRNYSHFYSHFASFADADFAETIEFIGV